MGSPPRSPPRFLSMSRNDTPHAGTRFTRRRLLGLSLAGAFVAPRLTGCAGPLQVEPHREEALFRISLAQWSLHRTHQSGTLATGDFARHARDAFGLEAVEYVSSLFPADPTDASALAALRRHHDGLGVRTLLIMVDGEGTLGAASRAARDEAVDRHVKWIGAARTLGGHAIRVNAHGEGSWDERSARVAESLHRLALIGDEHGIDVVVENHGGPSSNGGWLAKTLRAADHPRVGSLPDFGNFRIEGDTWYDRYRGVAELMPFARAVSAKSNAFDAAGNETGTDYERMLRIVLDAGYRGWIGIEYEGGAHSEDEGIRLTKDLLERTRARLSPLYS